MTRSARPSLTDEMIDSLAESFAMGVPADQAARFAGIAPSTFYKWQSIGRQEEEHRAGGGKPNRKLDLFVEFVERIEKGRAAHVHSNLGIIRSEARNGNWQAAAWSLERRYPKEFGRVSRTELTGAQGGPVKTETTVVSDADILSLANEIAGLAPMVPPVETGESAS